MTAYYKASIRFQTEGIRMKEKLKYLFSSGVAFGIDYVLLLVFERSLPVASLELGALLAWVVSSLTNFFINRNFVFKSDAPLKKALPEYYALAGVVFILKTYVVLELMTRFVGIPLEYAKPVAEVIFFVSNFLFQKVYIFGKRKGK